MLWPWEDWKRRNNATQTEGPHRITGRAIDFASKLREPITTLTPDDTMETLYQKITPQCPAKFYTLAPLVCPLLNHTTTTSNPINLLTFTMPQVHEHHFPIERVHDLSEPSALYLLDKCISHKKADTPSSKPPPAQTLPDLTPLHDGDDPEDLPIATVHTLPRPTLSTGTCATHMQHHTALTDLSPFRSSISNCRPPEMAKVP